MSESAAVTAIWVLVADLFLRVRLEGLARRAGIPVRAFTDPQALVAGLDTAASADARPRLVLIDLHAPHDAAFALLAALAARAGAPPTLGFHSHVDVEIRDRATAAGCTRVVPRSAIMNRLADLVAELSAGA